MFQRKLIFPHDISFFLFGPRQCGKSTLIESWLVQAGLASTSFQVDLLKSDLFLKYSKDPALFREEVLHRVSAGGTTTVFVDEIQKIPPLLDEIQHLMGKTGCQFILSGSSARKLKRGGANMLAGRAIQKFLFPFVYEEVKSQFQLEKALQYGLLPAVFLRETESVRSILNTYAQTYLREEIQMEGLVRNLPGFSRFLDVACAQFTEITNYTSIGSECGVNARSVQGFYDILEDTLIGFRLPGFDRSVRKQLSSSPKFYFFDNGVTNAVNHLLQESLSPVIAGKLFEQWLMNEVRAFLSYRESDTEMYYWRTNNEAEIDLILARHKQPEVAIEFKYRKSIGAGDVNAFRGFSTEYDLAQKMVVCLATEPYQRGNILILPWQKFLEKLWSGEIV